MALAYIMSFAFVVIFIYVQQSALCALRVLGLSVSLSVVIGVNSWLDNLISASEHFVLIKSSSSLLYGCKVLALQWSTCISSATDMARTLHRSSKASFNGDTNKGDKRSKVWNFNIINWCLIKMITLGFKSFCFWGILFLFSWYIIINYNLVRIT